MRNREKYWIGKTIIAQELENRDNFVKYKTLLRDCAILRQTLEGYKTGKLPPLKIFKAPKYDKRKDYSLLIEEVLAINNLIQSKLRVAVMAYQLFGREPLENDPLGI